MFQERWIEQDDKLVYQRQQVGLQSIVDHAKALSNEGFHGAKDFKHVAKIPEIVIDHYCQTNQITMREFIANPEHIARLVNSPEFADFRIAPGKQL